MRKNFAKTKILATLGPATDTKEKLKQLVDAGLDAVRLNFSHGNYDYFENLLSTINEVSNKKSEPLTTLIDLQGPKIRIGDLEKSEIEIYSGNMIEITDEIVLGNDKKVHCSYHQIISDATIGDQILIDDGLIRLEVAKKKDYSLECKIIEGGTLRPKKGMNLPGMNLSTPAITEKDYENLEFALKHRIDYIALSFVRSPKDITELRNWLLLRGKSIPIIAKIEKPEAVNNFEKILEVSDGIMVARGDLGVELKPYQVPLIQKRIINQCNVVGKLVITATQMLESMISNPVPTRAEASDVANAVFDGTDVVMLSGETSVGKNPIATVTMMNKILMETEKHIPKKACHHFVIPQNLADNIFDSTSKAISCIADQINASLIVVFTHEGRKARVLSKFRPTAPIIAFSDNFETLTRVNLHWGIRSFFQEEIDNEEIAIKEATKILKVNELVKKGDVVLFTAGAPFTDKGRKTWLRFLVM